MGGVVAAVLEIDVLACHAFADASARMPDCGGRLRLLATIEACPPKVHRRRTKILAHLGREVKPPAAAAALALTWLPGFEPEWRS